MHPSDIRLIIDGRKWTDPLAESGEILLPPGQHRIIVSRRGFFSRRFTIDLRGPMVLEDRLERMGSSLIRVREIPTGTQPKSITFTPDGKSLIVPLLGAGGITVIEMGDPPRVRRISPPRSDSRLAGFVESALLPARDELWVSQMQADLIHIFRLSDLHYVESFSPQGTFPKVITVSPDEGTAYVSNWLSRDVSIIDVDSRSVSAVLPVGGTPRGMVLTQGGRFLYVCLYDIGDVIKINTRTHRIVGSIDCSPASMRHIVRDPATGRLYASDMHGGRVFVIDPASDVIAAVVEVDHKLNTIALTPDGRRLFISSRGPNNPSDYLLKGPLYGKIYVMDTVSLTIVDWIWARNQPTGLAVSPDGRTLAFSNFLDHTVEICDITRRRVSVSAVPIPPGPSPPPR